jgi:hypothetical protein
MFPIGGFRVLVEAVEDVSKLRGEHLLQPKQCLWHEASLVQVLGNNQVLPIRPRSCVAIQASIASRPDVEPDGMRSPSPGSSRVGA